MQIKSVHFVQDSFRKAGIQLKLVRRKKYMLNNIESSGIMGIFVGQGSGLLVYFFVCYCFSDIV